MDHGLRDHGLQDWGRLGRLAGTLAPPVARGRRDYETRDDGGRETARPE